MTLEKLSKLAPSIDEKGIYAKDIILELANDGFFEFMQRSDIFSMISNIAKVSNKCGTTGFCVWCQFALLWYVINSDNATLKKRYLPKIAKGKLLGGTALSNPMKVFANIEKINLKARKVDGGYIINGTLPWVSNIESNHIFGAIALDESNTPVMGLIHADERVVLSQNIKYSALDGSATKSVNLKDYFLSDSEILTKNIYEYLIKITPGFILLQTGLAAGIISASLEVIEKANKTHDHINAYIPHQKDEIANELNSLLATIKNLSLNIDNLNPLDVLKARLKGSFLTSKATASAVLHSGTKGYMKNSRAARLQREGNFVLIVTPSIKHLIKEIKDCENGGGCVKNWQKLKVVV
ncbi:MAG: acyl-CoA/acyl-ACP dehydrogenase [Campylobacter sp.]|nr:acyl-CoA/acyl-ACP dehydrogenase [Campylobacter sp.]